MTTNATINLNLTPTARLNQALDLLGHRVDTAPVHSSNLLHAIEIFSVSSGDTELEMAVRARIGILREAIVANRSQFPLSIRRRQV